MSMKQNKLTERESERERELVFQEAVGGNLRMDLCAGGVSVMTEPLPWDTHREKHTLLLHHKNTHTVHSVLPDHHLLCKVLTDAV